MSKAIIYTRVSTVGQANDGISIHAQESKVRAWCELNGYEVAGIYTDAGLSGKSRDKRVGLENALESLGDGDVLVVYSLSRLARSTVDAIGISDFLMKKGCDLVSLTEKIDTTTAAGKMVFRMLAVLSEFERDQIVERTKAALAHKKSNHERTGGVPYGFKLASDGVKLLSDQSEQLLIQAARGLRAVGLSLRKIAMRLYEQGFRNRVNGLFHAQTIKNILARGDVYVAR